jgi:hypothetical protein
MEWWSLGRGLIRRRSTVTLEAKWFSLVFSWRRTNAKATHEENWKNESDVIKKKMEIFFFFFAK